MIHLEEEFNGELDLELLYEIIEEDISLEEYNKILKSILKLHVKLKDFLIFSNSIKDYNFVDEIKYYTEWRKKIKSWINSQNRQETRNLFLFYFVLIFFKEGENLLKKL